MTASIQSPLSHELRYTYCSRRTILLKFLDDRHHFDLQRQREVVQEDEDVADEKYEVDDLYTGLLR